MRPSRPDRGGGQDGRALHPPSTSILLRLLTTRACEAATAQSHGAQAVANDGRNCSGSGTTRGFVSSARSGGGSGAWGVDSGRRQKKLLWHGRGRQPLRRRMLLGTGVLRTARCYEILLYAGGGVQRPISD
jgi:hypothetical protein